MTKDRFFTKLDWAAFWTATLATFAVYFWTLGPSVGLEDSGELATAAAHLGVPHPPGYPFWTLCSWLFCKLFSWVTYMGHPTPAWAVSCCSAVFGALAAGCTAMLICRSACDFIEGEGPWVKGQGLGVKGQGSRVEGQGLGVKGQGEKDGNSDRVSLGPWHLNLDPNKVLAFGGGVAGALTFALSPVEWSQSTIVEIYSLNALFLMWVFLLSYRWMRKPSDKLLWFTAFVFGLGLTNYQVLLFAVVPLALIIMLKNIGMFRDVFIYLIPVALMYQVMQIGQLGAASPLMQRDVIDKHIPVGVTQKLFNDDLLLHRYGYNTFKDLASGEGMSRRMVAVWRRQGFHLSPEIVDGMENAGNYDIAAHTSACPSTTLIIIGIILVVAAIVAALVIRRRRDLAAAQKALVAVGGAGVGAFLLSMLFSSEASWSGARFEIAPLIEPMWYAAIAALIAAASICATAVALHLEGEGSREKGQGSRAKGQGVEEKGQGAEEKGQGSRAKGQGAEEDDESPLKKLMATIAENFRALTGLGGTAKKWLIAAAALSLLAVVVALLAPKAGVLSLSDPIMDMQLEIQRMAQPGRMMTYSKVYSGPAYPWMKSTGVFAALIALLFFLCSMTKRGLLFAIPVAGMHIAVFTLLRNGAMNGLTHPASWWFCWAIAWNFVLLALAWMTLPHGRSVAGAAFFAQLGVSFYAYMPVVSDLRNPPMNWGYPRTWEGFKHAIMRGQYEAIGFQMPDWGQIKSYFEDVRVQFTDLLIPFALVPFAAGHWIVKKENRKAFWQWMIPAFVCFLLMSVLLVGLANVKGDLQDGFIQKVKFISSHAMLALWIGYGLVFAAVAGIWLAKKYCGLGAARAKLVAFIVAGLVIAVSFVYPLVDNYCGEYVLGTNEVGFKLGGSEQNDHTFGWQFGAYQLEGAKAIREQIEADEEPLPDPDWPAPMEPFSIFFGGTDPGRFVPTYMIYSAIYRPDIYLITQNALADDTYISVQRDLYGDEIWIPAKEDSEKAFSIYDAENTDKKKENGKLQVEGALNVMKINSILAQMMFEHDRNRHAFYVEESYVIQWMYPYLSPHGLIMRINPEKTPYDRDVAAKDRDFWDWYSRRLLADPMYRRDFPAQKSFSKLRAAIGGLYLNQGRRTDAENAYREAVVLYPASPEAVFRYAQEILAPRRNWDAITELMDYTDQIDPNNMRTGRMREFIDQMRVCSQIISTLEPMARKGSISRENARRLARCYMMVGRDMEAAMLMRNLIDSTRSADELREIARLVTAQGMFADASKALTRMEALSPKSSTAEWVALAKAQVADGKKDDARRSLEMAVRIDSEAARQQIATDDALMELK